MRTFSPRRSSRARSLVSQAIAFHFPDSSRPSKKVPYTRRAISEEWRTSLRRTHFQCAALTRSVCSSDEGIVERSRWYFFGGLPGYWILWTDMAVQ
jgi:hypothetical protein